MSSEPLGATNTAPAPAPQWTQPPPADTLPGNTDLEGEPCSPLGVLTARLARELQLVDPTISIRTQPAVTATVTRPWGAVALSQHRGTGARSFVVYPHPNPSAAEQAARRTHPLVLPLFGGVPVNTAYRWAGCMFGIGTGLQIVTPLLAWAGLKPWLWVAAAVCAAAGWAAVAGFQRFTARLDDRLAIPRFPVGDPESALGQVLAADLSDPDVAALTGLLIPILCRPHLASVDDVAVMAIRLWRDLDTANPADQVRLRARVLADITAAINDSVDGLAAALADLPRLNPDTGVTLR